MQGFRPDAAERAAASSQLTSRGRVMSDFLRACLRWVADDPDAALAAVGKHWPEQRQRTGRPRKNAPPAGK